MNPASAQDLRQSAASAEQTSNVMVADHASTFDLLIRGGRIVDGAGSPWYIADIAVDGGKIIKIGRLDRASALNVIDAKGFIVAPGFIDMMGQTATPMLDDPSSAINLLTQGITTINAGEGVSGAPLDDNEGKRRGWTTMAEYFALLDIQGLPVNVVQTVGHTQVRRLVLGDADRRPDKAELKTMEQLVREAMEAGAIGVSTALIYPPAVYAQTEEIAALAKVAGEHGGGYFTHMRNEGDQLLEAIDEALDIGRIGRTPVHIFHLKTAGQQNWGKMPLAVARIQSARAAGEQVTADIYPYINNGLEIAALIHPRHFVDGRARLRGKLDDPELRSTIRNEMETTQGWENWYRNVNKDWDRVIIGEANDAHYKPYAGQSIAKIARATNEDEWDTFFNLAKSGAAAMPQSMTDANKILALQQNFVSFCTDVGPAGTDRTTSHPRAFGSFPKLISRYVRELGVISLERLVAQASSTAANSVFVYDRGRIAEGLAADLIVFNFDTLQDNATFANPTAVSEGMKYVIVNGEIVLDEGTLTRKRPGRVLRGPGYDEEQAPHAVSDGELNTEMKAFDRMLQEFMRENRVQGAAFAVTRDSRIIYSRAFGYSDLSTHEKVKPTSLFRIASISKPITAVSILQLVENGKLRLDEKIFDVLDYESAILSLGDIFDHRLRNVTIQHLLEHRGGWDRDKSFDPMFQSVRFAKELDMPSPAGAKDVIMAMLRQPLDFVPGERFAYSNFGYCLLGRVVAMRSGMNYEDYVKQSVLAPLGITSMRLGATRIDGRANGEVRYYQPGQAQSVFEVEKGENVPLPYGAWNLEAMDAHGGWIASAVDLAKFAAALDDPEHSALLSREKMDRIFARPEGLAGYDTDGSVKPVYYALGWHNRVVGGGKVNHWHTGSLPGTAAILIKRHDGFNFVALFNSRISPTSKHLGQAFDEWLSRAIALPRGSP